MKEIIKSSKNKKIKEIKRLHLKKNRWREKKYIIEGIRAIEQVLKGESLKEIEEIVFSKKIYESSKGKELIEKIQQNNMKHLEVSEEVFKNITLTESPQYIMAIVKFKFYKIEEIKSKNKRFLFLDRIQDPGNIGTIIRTAEAMGFCGIVINSGCVDIFSAKVQRSTMGVQIPIIYYENSNEVISDFKKNNIKIVSSCLESSNNIFDINLNSDIAIVIGNEANGISENIIKCSDETFKIPMIGRAESLNAATASSIIMYESLRQKIKGGEKR